MICGITAMNRGLGFGRVFGLSLFFSLVIGIIIASLSPANEDITREEAILTEPKRTNRQKLNNLQFPTQLKVFIETQNDKRNN
jgi:hypothetical protein